MLYYSEDYKGYLISGKPATREIDLLMGQPYKYQLSIAQNKAVLFTLTVPATPEDLANDKDADRDLVSTFGPNNVIMPVELGTRGYGFGIKSETWDRIRSAALPYLKRLIDSGAIQKGGRQEIAYQSLMAKA